MCWDDLDYDADFISDLLQNSFENPLYWKNDPIQFKYDLKAEGCRRG
jgi:hypothetical protein